jgi:hypothetical protein
MTEGEFDGMPRTRLGISEIDIRAVTNQDTDWNFDYLAFKAAST